jgi:hypothetical protein
MGKKRVRFSNFARPDFIERPFRVEGPNPFGGCTTCFSYDRGGNVMLTKWFARPTSRSLDKDRSFRPWLESLEERNAPGGGPGPGGDDHGGGDDHHHPPPPPPAQVNNGVNNNITASAGNGNHGSFNNSTITGSFNNTINNTVNVMVNMAPGQAFAVEGLFGISGFLSTALSNPNLGALLNDEIALAVDNYLTTPAVAMSLGLSASTVSTLSSDAATLSAAIAANPLEASPFGSILGTVAYDVTLHALTSAGP